MDASKQSLSMMILNARGKKEISWEAWCTLYTASKGIHPLDKGALYMVLQVFIAHFATHHVFVFAWRLV